MTVENDRPQDVGRRHRRASPAVAPGPETLALLERYRQAMRAELAMLLELLEARRVGLMPDAPVELVVPIGERAKLWDLAIRLGRELAGAGSLDPEPPAPLVIDSGRRRGAPALTARQRRQLGAPE